MAGNPKSLKIDGLKDQYGRIIYNRQDCYEMLYNGEDISKIKELEWHEDIEKYNKAIGLNNLETDLLQPISKNSKELSEIDDDNQIILKVRLIHEVYREFLYLQGIR